MNAATRISTTSAAGSCAIVADRTGAEREVEFSDVLGPQIANELDQLVVGLRDNNEQKCRTLI